MKPYRTLALAALLSIGVAGASFADTKAKTSKPAHKTATAAAPQYECAHCNVKLSAKEAKAHGMKCPDCGAKLTLVKKPAAGAAKAKKS